MPGDIQVVISHRNQIYKSMEEDWIFLKYSNSIVVIFFKFVSFIEDGGKWEKINGC